jgi:phosphoglucosamine mutase
MLREDGKVRVVLGGDTRGSTPTICEWLSTGLAAAGVELTFLGTVPTPVVAFAAHGVAGKNGVAGKSRVAAGVAVSASHNPYRDNGIKILDGEGYKWGPDKEAALEARLEAAVDPGAADLELTVDHGAIDAYLAALRGNFPRDVLDGFSVALDTGNGAASPYARELFESLGAKVCLRHAEPNGKNINAGCGSTNPEVVAEMVLSCECDAGFSFDGDADRVILADEKGQVRDGDVILYLWGRALKERGDLPGDRVVATSMSNLGLEVALRGAGIELERSDGC